MAPRANTAKRRLLGGRAFEYDPTGFRRPIVYGQVPSQHAQLLHEEATKPGLIEQLGTLPGLFRGALEEDPEAKAKAEEPPPVDPDVVGHEIFNRHPNQDVNTDIPREDMAPPAGRLLTGGYDPQAEIPAPVIDDNPVHAGMSPEEKYYPQENAPQPVPQPSEDPAPVPSLADRLQNENDVRSYIDPENQSPTPSAQASSASPPATPDNKKGRLMRGDVRTSADIYNDIEGTYKVKPRGPMGENREKSFSKRLFGGIGAALEALPQDASIENVLAAVGVGGLGSAFSPRFHAGAKNFSDRNELMGEYDRTQKREAYETKQAKTISDAADTYSKIQRREDQSTNEAAERNYKDNQKEWDALKFVYQQSDEFDPDDAKNSEIIKRMQRAKFPIFRKKQGESFEIAPDGRMYNKRTGQVMSGESFAKPPGITMNELPDSLVGLEDDSALATRAKAKVGKLPEGRRVRPDVLANLPAAYKNGDGSLNEQKFLSDKAMGITDLNTSDLYEGMPSDYDQRLASEVNKLRQGQQGKRAAWDKFRLAIVNHSSPSNPEYEMTSGDLVEAFKVAAKIGPKALETLYDRLKKTRIKG